MSHDDTKDRERLLDQLDRTGERAVMLEQTAQEIAKTARLQRDLIPALRECIRAAPTDPATQKEIRRQVAAWEGVREVTEGLAGGLALAASYTATSGAALNTTVMFASYTTVPQEARERVEDILQRAPLLEEVRAGLRRLGLDAPVPGRRSSLQLLQEAEAALEIPAGGEDGGAIGALLPVRQCIDSAIDELMRRRPQQEPGRGPAGERGRPGKILSIGRQCARGEIGADVFATIGHDIEQLYGRLSAAKDRAIGRAEIVGLFNRTLFALTTLLDSLDEKRLRPV